MLEVENKNVNLLIVDDDASIRNSLVFILKDGCGYNVFSAEEGFQALDVMSKNKIDVLITDINMPNGMGGFELIEKTPENITKIMVLSGYIDNKELIDQNKRVKAFFPKPFEIEPIIETLKEI